MTRDAMESMNQNINDVPVTPPVPPPVDESRITSQVLVTEWYDERLGIHRTSVKIVGGETCPTCHQPVSETARPEARSRRPR